MKGEINFNTCYRNKVSGHHYHILTYIKTITFGMTLLAEFFNHNETNIIPVNKDDFDNNISEYEEITEEEFGK